MRYFPRYVKGKGFKQQKWPSPKWNCHGELFHCNSTWANNMLKLHGDPLCFKIIAWSIPCHRAPISVTLWECSIWPLAVVRPFIRQWSTAICRETIQSELSDCRVVYNATDRRLRSRTPARASQQPRTNQHVSRQQLGGRDICASSRPRPWLVSLGRGQNWAPRKPRIKIGTRGSPLHFCDRNVAQST